MPGSSSPSMAVSMMEASLVSFLRRTPDVKARFLEISRTMIYTRSGSPDIYNSTRRTPARPITTSGSVMSKTRIGWSASDYGCYFSLQAYYNGVKLLLQRLHRGFLRVWASAKTLLGIVEHSAMSSAVSAISSKVLPFNAARATR